nr:hemolysin expression modulator Hha [Pseudomonas aeruginosa]
MGRSWTTVINSGECVNKQDWLFKLRKTTELATLEKIIERKENTLTDDELVVFYSASDHRMAEIKVGKLFDKIPAHVWKYVT